MESVTPFSDEADARPRLAAIPGFADLARKATLTRLPGLTNRVYRIDGPDGRFVLRIPGDHTAAIIDRAVEAANTRAAARAGIAPDVVYVAPDGVMLTRLVEGAETLIPERMIGRPGAIERVAASLRHLHSTVPFFAGRFEAFATLDRYAALLETLGAGLTARQRDIVKDTSPVREALAAAPVTLKPCHCDPSGGNLLDTGERIWLVDWEYSGMNDPAWDLAYCSVQAVLSPAADARLLSAYFERDPTPGEAARVTVMKAPVELMSALWALIQEAQGNRAADFADFAERTFEAAAERMESEAFRRALLRIQSA